MSDGRDRPLLLSLLVFIVLAPTSQAKFYEKHVDVLFPNEKWQSNGCAGNGFDELDVFGAVRLAVKTEYRELFLAIDSSWMDRLLNPGSRVVVTCIPHDQLAHTKLPVPDLDGMGWVPKTIEEDVLHAIYSHVPSSSPSPSVESSAEEQPVDRFLLHNPCWTVLHDAVALNFSVASSSPGQQLRHQHHHHHHNHLASTSGGAGVMHPAVYTRANILVKLPAFPLQMTCKLFLAMTKRQFPLAGECPKEKEKERRFFYAMQSFGFGGEANKVVKTFAYNLASHESRVYVAPLADKYEWSWANVKACGEARLRHDPWSCSFLPISNCTYHSDAPGPAYTSSQPAESDIMHMVSQGWGDYGPNKNTQHAFLKSLKIDGNMLKKFGDGTALESEPATWVGIRLYAFLMRPNTRSRYLMRQALDTRVIRLRRAVSPTTSAITSATNTVSLRGGTVSSKAGAEGEPASPPTTLTASSTAAAPSESPPLGFGAGLGLGVGWGRNCLGMHVRNADVLTDWRKGRKVDRSFNAHVYLSHNITRALGLRDVFLATDNSSLLHIAPLEYPEYRWFAQQRPITVYEQQASRGSLHHLHESEPQREIANLLVDALLVGRCEALVGQGDGSVTLLYHMFSCNLGNVECSCPPFYDLQRIADDGLMPYVGAHFDNTTLATFHWLG